MTDGHVRPSLCTDHEEVLHSSSYRSLACLVKYGTVFVGEIGVWVLCRFIHYLVDSEPNEVLVTDLVTGDRVSKPY